MTRGGKTMLGSKILLVDDELVFTGNMSKLLRSRGYQVTAVNSGDRAIIALETEKFDVVVLDLKMPGMDGIATLKVIKKLGIFTETLILTGHGSIDTALEAIRLGAYDYLTKPCEIGELVTKIEGAWETKDASEKKDIQERIHKVVESPRAAFDVFGKEKKPRLKRSETWKI
jgi:DNA-binding NtrC family response regulator